MGTLLDHHLASFDTWLRAYIVSSHAASRSYHFLTVFTLLDQLNPEQFDWDQFSVILQNPLTSAYIRNLHILFDETKSNIEFTRIVSKFLTDRDRARSLWINSHNYADLATYILKILGDK